MEEVGLLGAVPAVAAPPLPRSVSVDVADSVRDVNQVDVFVAGNERGVLDERDEVVVFANNERSVLLVKIDDELAAILLALRNRAPTDYGNGLVLEFAILA